MVVGDCLESYSRGNNPVGQTGPTWDIQTVRIMRASEDVPATRTQLQDTEPQVEVGFYK